MAAEECKTARSHWVIQFYGQRRKWGEFSNFYAAPITLKGKEWPTTEHYFQAMKFEGTEHEEEIRTATGPGQAAKMGRSRSRPLRKDWEEVKEEVMMEACLAKFSTIPRLKKLLLSTGDAKLVEHTRNDRYWGDGADGQGKNRLGVTLMFIRDRLRKEADAAASPPA